MTTTNKSKWAACAAFTILAGPVGAALGPTDTPELILKISGSTIWDNNFATVLNAICLPDTLSSYVDGDVNGKGTYWKAWFCQIDGDQVAGLGLKNPKTLILKRNRNGMITGVAPLLEPAKSIKFMDIRNTGQCALNEGSTNAYTCRTSQQGDLIDSAPDVGVLDIDPYLMHDSNYTKKIDGVAFQEPNPERMKTELQVTNAGGVVQNTPVSLNLRDALQAAQVAEGKLASHCVGDESLACIPSLEKSFLTKVFLGQVFRWSEVAYAGKPLTQYAQAPLDTDVVHVCRRNKGASTQAAINSYFLRNPCSTSGGTPVEISNPRFGPVVVAPGQVTEEEKCLDDFSANTNNSGLNNSGRAWAVGMLTTERNKDFKYQYRYIKIDGVEPSVEKVFSGDYPYFSEAAFAWLKAAPKLGGDLLVLAKKIAGDATTPALFGALNAKISQPFGNGSFIATAGQGYTAPAVFNPALPITPFTHQPAGHLLDNCIIPVRQ